MDNYFARFRHELPAAEKYTYMNSAGCGPLPRPVVARMNSILDYMLEEGQVNVSVHDWLKDYLEEVRKDVAEFVNASPKEIFFVRCIAEGLNTITRMVDWSADDEILITDQENPASILPMFVLEPIYGTKTKKFCALGSEREVVGNCFSSITSKTKMITMSHVLHTTGAAIPVSSICHEAESKGIITVVDGAQASGNILIDVKKIGCSFYLFSCHKWLCGPEGIAAVYIREDRINDVIVPFGGVGVQDSFDFCTNKISFKPDARRFEYGGRHTVMYSAFSETIRFAKSIGFNRIYSRIKELHLYCRNQFISKLPDVKILSPDDYNMITGIFAFQTPGIDHRNLVKYLWETESIIIQWRTENLYSGENGARVSLNWFITEPEIDKLVEAIRKYLDGLN